MTITKTTKELQVGQDVCGRNNLNLQLCEFCFKYSQTFSCISKSTKLYFS